MNKTKLGFFQNGNLVQNAITSIQTASPEEAKEVLRFMNMHYDHGQKSVITSIAQNAAMDDPYESTW